MSSGNMLTRPSHIIALCSMANFINSADRVIMPIAIVPMADEFKWDLHGQGWVLSSFAVGYMSSQVTVTLLRAQELFESRGGRPGLPVPNSPYGLCGHKATLNDESVTQQRAVESSVPNQWA